MYRIAVDGKPLGYIRAEDILQVNISIGKSIDVSTYTELVNRVKYTSFLNIALGYASRRLHSKEEVINHIKVKGCSLIIAREIADRLCAVGIIDENKLAQAYVRDAQIKGTVSKKALELKLKKKRINPKIIAVALNTSKLNETNALDVLIGKKRNQQSYQENPARLFRYLLSKGFSFNDIAARIGTPASGHNRISGRKTPFE